MPHLKLRAPKPHGNRAVPATFLVVVSIKKNDVLIRSIKVELVDYNTELPLPRRVKGKIIDIGKHQKPQGNGFSFRWVFRVDALTTGAAGNTQFKLLITGHDSDDVEQERITPLPVVNVKPRALKAAPTVEYPEDPQTLTGEENSEIFYAYGGLTGDDVSNAMVDAIPRDYLYSELSESFWFAEFDNLNLGNGNHILSISWPGVPPVTCTVSI